MADEELRPVLEGEIERKRDRADYYERTAASFPARIADIFRDIAKDERENATILRWALDTDFRLSADWFQRSEAESSNSHRVIVWKQFPKE